ncbi:MAG: carboxymuconolactone decarboxylase family protein [Geobacteraceae bacterium]
MNRKITLFLAIMLASICSLTVISEAQPMEKNQALRSKQQGIIPIAAFTASGDLERLKTALREGLDAGLTINEIKEVLVQMYAYAGFPRSLNGLDTFIAVLDERKKRGIKDVIGRDASPLPADKSRRALGTEIQTGIVGRPVSGPTYDFAPVIDRFLKEHLFADIFGRDILDFQERELATVSALASLPAENQLRSHLNGSLNVGLTEAQIRQFVSVLANKVGKDEAERASRLLAEVLKSRKASSGK